MWRNYNSTTPQRVKLIDAFMAFLVLVGVLQFVYCVLVGNYVSRELSCFLLSFYVGASGKIEAWNGSAS